ncbi:ABC transporter substrate-binding protein [Nocardioides houyundeii]|uniref:ABC transporter substrate-binding protein n=1 Tax=Nocardioides houyundeii TaxID=2045452 RepID=UPI000C755B92|nr:ABC transporter substrate-binding protein [Nocardioides houyundeii]
MKNLLRLTALATVSALALTGCSGGSTPGGSTASAADTTLNLAFLGDIPPPDPDTAYDGAELNLANSAYEGLLGYQSGQSEAELVGKLATEWEANDDNTVFTFTLREDVTFHDGTPFDSSAVKASFDRRTAVGEGPAYMVAGVTKVETPSPSEVVITLEAPNSSFLDLLASPFGPKMISPQALKAHPVEAGADTDWFDTHDAGTGPFTYGDFQPGVAYELEAFADYWGEPAGYQAVRFDVMSSMSTIQLKLGNGELDGLIGYSDDASFRELSKNQDLEAYAFPSMQTPTLFVNPKSAALGDQATRVQLLSGIDFPALAEKALGETAEPTDEVFPKNLLPAEGNKQVIEPDPDALDTLAAGALSGRTISCGYAESTPAAQVLCDNLAAVLNGAGIKTKSVGFAPGAYYEALAKGASAPDVTFFTGFPDTAHPDAWGFVFYTPGGGLDLFGAEVPGLADLLAKAVETNDLQAYGEAARMVSESGLWYSVATKKGTAVFSDDVAGVDEAWHPVITDVLDLSLVRPTP